MNTKLDKIYYDNFWKGKSAIKKLALAANITETEAKNYLSKQPIWQIYLPAPKIIRRPKFDITIPNKAHQADLLYLPHDNNYKYALTVIDVASRYKEAEPLKNKQASTVAKAFNKIYKRSLLTFPETLMVDPGSEFKGDVIKLMKEHNVTIRTGKVEIHRDQALVERFNRTLSEQLFSYQYFQELKTGETNREWVKRLPKVINKLNNTVTRLIKLKPIDAIKMPTVSSESQHVINKPTLELGTSVRYLYTPGEIEKDTRRRATDPIWSVDVYEIKTSVTKPGVPTLYYLDDKKVTRSFVREELQVINQ